MHLLKVALYKSMSEMKNVNVNVNLIFCTSSSRSCSHSFLIFCMDWLLSGIDYNDTRLK